MKKFLLLISFCWLSISYAFTGEDISYFRTAFNGIKDFKTAEKFLKTEISDSIKSNVTAIVGYKGVCSMMMAQYVYNPFTKLSYFKSGKKILETSIKIEKNVENIYLRLIVQLHAPSFLGYNKKIKSDKKYIETNITSSSVPDETKKYILKNLMETGKTESLRALAKKYGAV